MKLLPRSIKGKMLVVPIYGLTMLLLFGSAYVIGRIQLTSIPEPPAIAGTDSIVYAADGKTILGYLPAQQGSSRIELPHEKIPDLMRDAILAAEDPKFKDHGPISWPATARAVGQSLLYKAHLGGSIQGGSTITQQLAKNLIGDFDQTANRKVDEAVIAYKLESKYTKDQILDMYLNIIYFARGAYGIERASQVYFGHSAAKLTAKEAATLAALVKSPGYYGDSDNKGNPVNDDTTARRNYVLRNMLAAKTIDQATYNAIVGTGSNKGQAVKFTPPPKDTDTAKKSAEPYIVADVQRTLLAQYGTVENGELNTQFPEAMLARGGLHITTTIESEVQTALNTAAKRNRPTNNKDLLIGATLINPLTGGIVATYGGANFDTYQYDSATQVVRPIGSTMKAVNAANAVAHGISLMSVLQAPASVTINGATIRNWDHTNHGKMTIVEGLAQSSNTVMTELSNCKMPDPEHPDQIIDLPGVDGCPTSSQNMIDLGRKMGLVDQLVPGTPDPKMEPVTTATLGVSSHSTVQVASTYATIAAQGIHHTTHLIGKITTPDRDDYEYEDKSDQPLDDNQAGQVARALVSVITNGTGKAAAVPGIETAGKTGTATNSRGLTSDSWMAQFTGVDSNSNQRPLACAAWMGWKDSNRELTYGGGVTARICGQTIAATVHTNVPIANPDLNQGTKVGIIDKPADPQPTLTVDPTVTIDPSDTPEPGPSDSPTPSPKPSPQPTPTPTTEPTTEPDPNPTPTSQPDAGIVSTPDPSSTS